MSNFPVRTPRRMNPYAAAICQWSTASSVCYATRWRFETSLSLNGSWTSIQDLLHPHIKPKCIHVRHISFAEPTNKSPHFPRRNIDSQHLFCRCAECRSRPWIDHDPSYVHRLIALYPTESPPNLRAGGDFRRSGDATTAGFALLPLHRFLLEVGPVPQDLPAPSEAPVQRDAQRMAATAASATSRPSAFSIVLGPLSCCPFMHTCYVINL